jgi:hypothetical protein
MKSPSRHSEAAFETVIEQHLLGRGYVAVPRDGFDRERAIFPSVVLEFIKDTQPKEWAKLEALHGPKTGEQILADLCKWMDLNGSLATLRHGFKCHRDPRAEERDDRSVRRGRAAAVQAGPRSPRMPRSCSRMRRMLRFR